MLTASAQSEAIAARLKQLRTRKGLTQAEVAEAIGVSEAGYGNYETGFRTPKRENLIALADLYNVSVDYILGETESIIRPGEDIELPPELQAYFRKGRWDSLVPNDRRRLLALIRGFMDESDPDTNPDTKE